MFYVEREFATQMLTQALPGICVLVFTFQVTEDDGIRPQTTMAGLAKLRPAFKKGGTTTAGT